LALAVSAAFASLPTLTWAIDGADFSGTWELDRELSDDPRAAMREAVDANPRSV
jgi:hypothetical protein